MPDEDTIGSTSCCAWKWRTLSYASGRLAYGVIDECKIGVVDDFDEHYVGLSSFFDISTKKCFMMLEEEK